MLECFGAFFSQQPAKVKSLWLSWKTILNNSVDGIPIKNIIVSVQLKQSDVPPETCFTNNEVDNNFQGAAGNGISPTSHQSDASRRGSLLLFCLTALQVSTC